MAVEDLPEQMEGLARAVRAEDDLSRAVERICLAAVALVGRSAEAGISIAHRARRIENLGATAPVVRRGDELQLTLGEGPCLDAAWDEQQVVARDLTHDDRWPRWAPRMVDEFGLRSMLCTQLFTNERQLGALNLYSMEPDAFDEEAREVAHLLAVHAAMTVAAAQQVEGLTFAVDRRATIGKAIGIVMVKYDLDDDRAFTVLQRLSSHQNRKLYDVAQEVLKARALPLNTLE